jgi:two-component system cell cycle sensor histidine kinase/response regulator CckA
VDAPEITILRKENQELKSRLQALEAALDKVQAQGKVRWRTEHPGGSVRLSMEQDNAQSLMRFEEIERKYALVENLPGMVYRRKKDEPWVFEYVSRGAFALTGHDPSDFMKNGGIAFADLVHPEDVNMTWGEMKKAAEKGIPYQFRYRLRHVSGQYKWVWEQGCGIFSSRGDLVAFEGFILDVTEHRETEEALWKSERIFRVLVQSSPLAIITITPEGIVTSWNKAAEKIFGWSEEEALGRFLPFVPPEKEEESRFWRERVIKEGVFSSLEFERRKKGGAPIHVNISASPFYDIQGKAEGMMLVIEDITERKLLEAQLIQAQKMESIGRLAGGVAHDFNNLLTPILGYAEMLLYEIPSDHPHHTFVTQIREAGERARNLVRQLLAFSRKQVLHMTTVDVNAVISAFEKMLRRMIGEDIQLETVLDPSIGVVNADISQLEQVLLNLAVNARDAMPEGGKLTIETREACLNEGYAKNGTQVAPGRYIMVAVRDTGQGMEEETRKKIFEPFFTTKDKFKGTGLGLSTVYGIVKQHGGAIFVDSEPGVGSTFKIYLPKVEEQQREESSPLRQPETLKRGATVLLLEDDQVVRTLAAAILRQHGYTVLEAEDAEHAVSYAKNHNGPIHLLLSDVVMPDMNGPEAYKRIALFRPGIKVLYMSGYADDAIARQGMMEEGIHFLEKPFTLARLLEKINKAMEG